MGILWCSAGGGNPAAAPNVITGMRRLSLPYRLVSVAVLVGALLPAAACARTHAGSDAGGPSAPDSGPSPATTASASPLEGCPGGLRSGRVALSEADDGKQFCLATGTALEVYLHGTTDSRWSQPAPDGTALRRAFNGKGALAVGVTAGFFTADQPGVAHVTAQRAVCPSPSAGMACHALVGFRVTISVR